MFICAVGLAPVGYGQADRASQLIAELKDRSARTRESAASELGKSKDSRAVEPLIAALKDDDASVRGNAAVALGAIKDARVVEPLRAALRDTKRVRPMERG